MVLRRLRAERQGLHEGGEGGGATREGPPGGLRDLERRLQRQGQLDAGRIVDRAALHGRRTRRPTPERGDDDRVDVGDHHHEDDEGRGQAAHGPEAHDAAVFRHRLAGVVDRGDARGDGRRLAFLVDQLGEVEPQAGATVLLLHLATVPRSVSPAGRTIRPAISTGAIRIARTVSPGRDGRLETLVVKRIESRVPAGSSAAQTVSAPASTSATRMSVRLKVCFTSF